MAAWLQRQQRPARALALVVFLAGYLPVANLFLLLPTIFAERLLYLPSVGFCLLLADWLTAWREQPAGPPTSAWRKLLLAATAIFLLLHAGRAALRTPDWRDQRSLFTSAVAATPRSARSWHNLGVQELDDQRPEAAAACFREALAIAPDWASPSSYLGIALDLAGDPVGARRSFERAFTLAPDCGDCAENLARFYLRHGHPELAVTPLESLRRLGKDPERLRTLERLHQESRQLTTPTPDGVRLPPPGSRPDARSPSP